MYVEEENSHTGSSRQNHTNRSVAQVHATVVSIQLPGALQRTARYRLSAVVPLFQTGKSYASAEGQLRSGTRLS